jgi:uncharacterized protein (TIGR03382 family)
MDALTTAVLLALIAGYGDVDDAGYPSHGERDLHLWTNAVRVDPAAFEEEYDSGPKACTLADFEPSEKEAKSPIYYSRTLNEAARFHSDDMQENQWFDHDSSDGTSFPDRTARYYTETTYIGENIAFGYVDGFDTVMHGLMCSPGHRSNIMHADWTELGTGTNFEGVTSWDRYYTQDFGAGTQDSQSAIAMGVHSPAVAGAGWGVRFSADYQGPGPESFRVVVNGVPYALELEWGDQNEGVWRTAMNLPEDRECHEYFFIAVDSQRTSRFPEEGSYQTGACETPFYWVDRQLGISGQDDLAPDTMRGELTLVGCSSVPTPPGVTWLLLLGIGIRRRHG